MTIARRTLLGTGLAGTLGALLPVPGLRNLAFAASDTTRPILVIVHLRGGCDGLNLVSPATDPAFIEARVSDLRVAAAGADAGHALANGPDPKIDFRLHSQAGDLAELYQAGQLAFIHAVGLTDGTRSHFVATDMIEHGVADAAGLPHAAVVSRLPQEGLEPHGFRHQHDVALHHVASAAHEEHVGVQRFRHEMPPTNQLHRIDILL